MDPRKRQLPLKEVVPRRSKRLMASNRTPIVLTNVMDDCLEHIFMYLSVEDLLNIAHTNKQLKPAADEAFRRKFGKEKFKLNYIYKFEKLTFKLLRCFGHLMSNLDVENVFKKNGAKVFEYVNKYCSESLLIVSFSWIQKSEFEELKAPFTNVECLELYQGTLGTESDWLSKLFPKIKKITIEVFSLNPRCFEVPFHHLQELDIHGRKVSKRSLMNCFRLNPQLRRLSVYGWTAVLQSASEHLKQLEHLQVRVHYEGNVSAVGGTFSFDSLTSLDLSNYCMPVPSIKISAHQLREIKLHYSLDSELIPFFKTHTTVTKLTICRFYGPSLNLTQIAKSLPLLKELQIEYFELDSTDAVQFVRMCESLQIFRFNLKDDSQFDSLRQRLGNEWETSKTGYTNVEIKRNL